MSIREYNNDFFTENHQKISDENHTGVRLILLFDAIILAINVLVSILTGEHIFKNLQLNAQLIYIVIAIVLYLFVFRRNEKTNYTLLIYFVEAPMLLSTLFGGIIGKPHELTFTFLFFLLLFPLLILDKPWHIDTFVISFAILFGIADFMLKDHQVFYKDISHTFNITLMCIAASRFFLNVRIKNIRYAGYFAEKADEDPLTGLYNRAGARHHINAKEPGALIYLDLDNFKQVNDQFGHEAGDTILKNMSQILHDNFRRQDAMIRLGGDEFAVYAAGLWRYAKIEEKLEALLKSIETLEMHDEKGASVHISASIGCAYAPNGASSIEELVRVADEAMYKAKKNGRNGYSIQTIKAETH